MNLFMPVHYGTLARTHSVYGCFSALRKVPRCYYWWPMKLTLRCLGTGDAFRCGAKLAARLVWQLRLFGIVMLFGQFCARGISAYFWDLGACMCDHCRCMAVGTRLPHSTGATDSNSLTYQRNISIHKRLSTHAG